MAVRGEPDWTAIKLDYISTADSYRKIAARHGLSPTTIHRKSVAEGWPAERKQYADAMLTKQAEAQGEAQGAALAEGVQECVSVAKKLLQRLLERVEMDDAPILPQEYRQLTGAVKDIRDILTSDLDVQKKKADIEAVRRQLGEGKDNTVRVIIDGGADFDG